MRKPTKKDNSQAPLFHNSPKAKKRYGIVSGWQYNFERKQSLRNLELGWDSNLLRSLDVSNDAQASKKKKQKRKKGRINRRSHSIPDLHSGEQIEGLVISDSDMFEE